MATLRGAIIASVTTLALLALAWGALPTAAETARPIDSGVSVEVNVGPTYRPGDVVEIHIWVTDNGTLVVPEWPDGWPHLHSPDLPDTGLIPVDEPEVWGHPGAFRTTVAAPDTPGLYAIHVAADVDGLRVFGFSSFVVAEEAPADVAQMAMIWSLASFAVSLVVIVLLAALLLRQRRGGSA